MDQPVQPPPMYVPRPPLSPTDERTWAMLANLTIVANLVTGFLGTLGALVIYLVFRDRSRYVAFQSLQAFVFQMITWVVAGLIATILWTLGGILSAICVGVLLFPLAALFSILPIAAVVYGIVAAVHTYHGEDFRYWLIGDWVISMQSGTGRIV